MCLWRLLAVAWEAFLGSQPLPFIHKRLSVNHCHYNYCYHYIYYYYYYYFKNKRSPVNRSLKCLYLQTSH